MKRIIAIAAVAALAACSKPAEAPAEPVAEAPAEAAPADTAVLAADGKPPAGKYEVTTAEGEVLMEELKPDGTYVQTKDGKVIETGKWVQKSPSQYCYTTDKEGAKEACNTEQVDANGVWTSVNPEGKTATVKRL